MTFSPSFNVILDKSLSEQEKNGVLDKIRKLEGVLGADFNKAASTPESQIFVNYTTNGVTKNPVNEVRKIKGVQNVRHYD